jgi:RNA polymerase sigma factor (sigma-70 family)
MNASNVARIQAPLLPVSDRQIVRLAARGEARAFAAIYERYHQELYRYCHSILGNGEDALDALHNTMARILRALPGEEREIALRPWLYRVAHNEAISLVRERRTHVELEQAREVESPGVEQQTAIRSELRQLTADLGQLADRQRSALVMRELSDLSYSEIAAALRTSEAAAKQTVYEARVALQALAEGREMDCEAVKRSISDGDGRLLRARRVRSHLRSCASCRAFSDGIAARQAQLTALAPPLSVIGAASLLHGLVGGPAQASAGGGGGILAGLLGGGAVKAVAGSTAVQVAVAGAITVGAGVEVAKTTDVVGGGGEKPVVQAPLAPGSSVGAAAELRPSIGSPVGAAASIHGQGQRADGGTAAEDGTVAGSVLLNVIGHEIGKGYVDETGNGHGPPAGVGPAAEGGPPPHSSAGGRGHGISTVNDDASGAAPGNSAAAPGHNKDEFFGQDESFGQAAPPGQLKREKDPAGAND